MPKNPWKKLSTEIVHQNQWYKIRHDRVIRPNGQRGDYFVLDHPGSVLTIALNDQNQFLLIGQFRYPVGIYSWEVPGGGSDDTTDPLQEAKRELHEETGITAADWQKIGFIQAYNGASNDVGHIFIAQNCVIDSHNEQAEEGIDAMKWVTFPEAFAMIKSADISDAQSISAITHAAIFLRKIMTI